MNSIGLSLFKQKLEHQNTFKSQSAWGRGMVHKSIHNAGHTTAPGSTQCHQHPHPCQHIVEQSSNGTGLVTSAPHRLLLLENVRESSKIGLDWPRNTGNGIVRSPERAAHRSLYQLLTMFLNRAIWSSSFSRQKKNATRYNLHNVCHRFLNPFTTPHIFWVVVYCRQLQ